MSISATHRKNTASSGNGIVARDSDGRLQRWFRSAIRAWQRRRMIAILSALDDRTLRDIGIHRGQIPFVVDQFEDRELRMVPLAPPSEPVDTEEYSFRKAA